MLPTGETREAMAMTATSHSGQLRRLRSRNTAEIVFFVDGRPIRARTGDSLLCAIMSVSGALRVNEFDGGLRAGFCAMGACQDCWVWVEGGQRIRACTTQVSAGLRISTAAPVSGALS